eukprot:scaffold29336_cov79-Skeletonema_marinoi.AAC.1
MNFMKGAQCPTNKYFDLSKIHAGRRNEAKAGPFLPAACGSTHQGESRVTVHSRESNGWRLASHALHSHNYFVEPCPLSLAIKAIHSSGPGE